jgi:hypothetical protein
MEERMITPRSLALAVAVLVAVVGCGGGDGGGGGDGPLRVAIFANTTFVNYDPTDVFAEASNLETALKGGADLYGQAGVSGLGLDVSSFTNFGTSGFSAALSGRRVLVIPELEVGSLAAELPFDTITLLREFLGGGGTLIVFRPEGNTVALLDAILSTALQSTGITPIDDPAPLDAGGAAGTPFAGGPASIETNDWTWFLVSSTLPANARKIYTYGGEPVVTVLPKGAGNVVVIGWDWFVDVVGETPDLTGWLEVVRRAMLL